MAKRIITTEAFAEMFDALKKIGTKPDLEISYQIAKNLKLNQKIYQGYEKEINAIQKDHVLKHPDGRPMTEENGQLKFKDKEAVEKLFLELAEKEVEIEVFEIQKEKYPDSCFAKIPGNLLMPLLDVIIVEGGLKKV